MHNNPMYILLLIFTSITIILAARMPHKEQLKNRATAASDTVATSLAPGGCIPITHFFLIDSIYRIGLKAIDSKGTSGDSLILHIVNNSQNITMTNVLKMREDTCFRNDLSTLWETVYTITLKAKFLDDVDLFKKRRLFKGIFNDNFKPSNLPNSQSRLWSELRETIQSQKSELLSGLEILNPEKIYEMYCSSKEFSPKQKLILYCAMLSSDLQEHLYWGIYSRISTKLDSLLIFEQFRESAARYENLALFSSLDTSLVAMKPDQEITFNTILESILRDAAWPEGLDFTEYFSLNTMLFNEPVSVDDSAYVINKIRNFGLTNRNLTYYPNSTNPNAYENNFCKKLDSLATIETNNILHGLSSELQDDLTSFPEVRLKISGKDYPDLIPEYKYGIALKNWCYLMENNVVPFDKKWIKHVILSDSSIVVMNLKNWNDVRNYVKAISWTDLSINVINAFRMIFGDNFGYEGVIDKDKFRSIVYRNDKLTLTQTKNLVLKNRY